MNKSIITTYIFMLGALISSSVFGQIENPEQVALLMENRNLKELYADFPNAMNIYKESKKDKVNGILLESLGIGIIVSGGYLVFKGILLEKEKSQSGYNLGLPDLTNLYRVLLVTFGALVGMTGLQITRSGSRKLNYSKLKRRGSAQQYIWDVEARASRKEMGSISIEDTSNGIGLVYSF